MSKIKNLNNLLWLQSILSNRKLCFKLSSSNYQLSLKTLILLKDMDVAAFNLCYLEHAVLWILYACIQHVLSIAFSDNNLPRWK